MIHALTELQRMSPRLMRIATAAIGVTLAFTVAEAQIIPMAVAVPKQSTASTTPCVPKRLFVKPIDDLREDASFQEFKQRLLNIAARHDSAALYRLLPPDFFEVGCCEDGPNYRGNKAIAEFKKMVASDPGIWLLVYQTLQVGVVKTERTYDGYMSKRPDRPLFCGPATDSPSISACDFGRARSDADDLAFAFVIGTRVPLRVTSDPSARVIATLSWDMVRGLSDDWSLSPNWAKVRLGDEMVGYVNRRSVHQFLDPTLCFGKERNGQWDIRGIDLEGD